MSLGSLVVSLGLDAASFTSGMSKAELAAARSAQNMADSMSKGIAGVITGFGSMVTAAGGYLVAMDAILSRVADYQDLADVMGDTAENLASLQSAATLSGVSMESLVTASVKLSSSLAKNDDESKGAAQGLKAIGLSAEEIKSKSPAAAIEAIALALAKYKDGAEKAAVQVAIFGKAGAQLAPAFKEISDAGGLVVAMSGEMIAAADAYDKKKKAVIVTLQTFAQLAAASAAGPLTDLATAFLAVAKEVTGVDEKTASLNTSNSIKEWAETSISWLIAVANGVDRVARVFQTVGTWMGAIGASAVALSELNFSGMVAISQAFDADIARINDPELAGDRTKAEMEKAKAARLAAQKQFNDRRDGAPLPTPGAVSTGGGGKEKAYTDDAATKYLAQLDKIGAVLKAQLESGVELTKAEEERVEFSKMIADLKGKTLTEDQKSLISGEATIRFHLDANVAAEKALDLKKQNLELEKLITASLLKDDELMSRRTKDTESANAAAKDYLATLTRGWAREREGMGQGESVRGRMAGRNQIDEKYSQQKLQLESDHGQGLDDETYNERLRIINTFQAKALTSWETHYDELKALQSDSMLGAQEALANYVDSASNNFKQMEGLVTGIFGGFEDAVVNFATTGKFEFKSFAASVIADMARIAARKAIVGIAGMMFGGGNTGFGTGSQYGNADYGASLATGTNYVPYDGMKATLHKGEAVVPKEYNPASGGSATGGGEINVNTNVILDSKGSRTDRSGDNDSTGRSLATTVEQLVRSAIQRETMQGGVLWKQRMGYT